MLIIIYENRKRSSGNYKHSIATYSFISFLKNFDAMTCFLT